jgi:prepilin-type processing-associated H-X9-DG protein
MNTKWATIAQTNGAQAATNARKQVFGSGHVGGANFLMCDGSVHFVTSNIALVTFVRLSVPNDTHPVELP